MRANQLLLLFAFAVVFYMGAARAEDASKDAPKDVVAYVNEQAITLAHVKALLAEQPDLPLNLSADETRRWAIEQLINQHVLLAAAKEANIAKQRAFRAKWFRQQDHLLREMYLTQAVEKYITSEALQDAYQQAMKEWPVKEELHVRHILVDDEKQAAQIIAQLQEGADFAKLAKKYSLDHTASKGGDLGFIMPYVMVPEFDFAARALKTKEISPRPILTRFGWHVIQVVARRPAKPPTLAELKPQLMARLSEEFMREHVKDLRADAEIEYINLSADKDD